MRKKHSIFSKERILDPVSGVEVPVVLNPRMEIADPQLPSKERKAQYLKFIKDQNASFCLFTPSGLKVSRVSGVSLSSQIELLATRYQFENESIIAQFDNTYYLAHLASGFVIQESLIAIEDFNYQELDNLTVIALQGVRGAAEMGVQTLNEKLLLSGRSVTKSHFFHSELVAFRNAGIRHPMQTRRIIAALMVIVVGASSIAFYQYWQERKRLIEQQQKAAVIPPKVGRDSSVPQLRAYAAWLQTNVATYRHFGLESIEISESTIALSGRLERSSALAFYAKHKELQQIPSINLELLAEKSTSSDAGSHSSWQLSLPLSIPINDVEQFGLDIYETYLVSLHSSLSRMPIQVSSQMASVNSYGVKEGVLQIQASLTSVSLLFDLANAMIGIASYVEILRLSYVDGVTHMELQLRLVGRS